MRPGFPRSKLEARYNVSNLIEDEWHSYSGEETRKLLGAQLAMYDRNNKWALNAGSGVYTLGISAGKEVCVDLFPRPIRPHDLSICASIEHLPFRGGVFDAIVCVGEVLDYCDPAAAISEFARVARKNSILIFDFGSSRSPRYWLRKPFGRAADLVTDQYNGSVEDVWIYDPEYISSLVTSSGYVIRRLIGIHKLSALARRFGLTAAAAVRVQRLCSWLPWPTAWADVTTIVAVRSAS